MYLHDVEDIAGCRSALGEEQNEAERADFAQQHTALQNAAYRGGEVRDVSP